MLKRQYDVVIEGNDWLTWFEGLKMLAQGKSTLVVTDNISVNLQRHLVSEIDRLYLMELGREWSISSLMNIDEYLTPAQVRLLIDDTNYNFGDGTYAHLMELMRKMPELYARYSYFWEKIRQEGPEKTNQFVNDNWKELFYKDYSQKEAWSDWPLILSSLDQEEGHPFNFFLQSLFQRKIEAKPNEYLDPSISIHLLSKWYFLDLKSIEARLKSYFLSKGGEVKQTTIADTQVDGGRLKNILLNSFEGVITPLSLYSRQMCNVMESGIRSLVGTWSFSFDWGTSFVGEKIFWVESLRLGTNWPWIEIEVIDSRSFNVELVYWAEAAGRPEFYFEKADDLVYRLLEKLIPSLNWRHFSVDRHYRPGSLSWGPFDKKFDPNGFYNLSHPTHFTAGQTGLLRSFLPINEEKL